MLTILRRRDLPFSRTSVIGFIYRKKGLSFRQSAPFNECRRDSLNAHPIFVDQSLGPNLEQLKIRTTFFVIVAMQSPTDRVPHAAVIARVDIVARPPSPRSFLGRMPSKFDNGAPLSNPAIVGLEVASSTIPVAGLS